MQRSATAAYGRFVKSNPIQAQNPGRHYRMDEAVFKKTILPLAERVLDFHYQVRETLQKIREKQNTEFLKFEHHPTELFKIVENLIAIKIKNPDNSLNYKGIFTLFRMSIIDAIHNLFEIEADSDDAQDDLPAHHIGSHLRMLMTRHHTGFNARSYSEYKEALNHYIKLERRQELKKLAELVAAYPMLEVQHYLSIANTIQAVTSFKEFTPQQINYFTRICSNAVQLLNYPNFAIFFGEVSFELKIAYTPSMKKTFNAYLQESDEDAYRFIFQVFKTLQSTVSNFRHFISVGEANKIPELRGFEFGDMSPSYAEVKLQEIERQKINIASRLYGNTMTGTYIGRPVITFEDGHAWYRIPSRASQLSRPAMGHCGNTASPRPGDEVWNLVKKNKRGGVKPAATFIVNFPEGPTVQGNDSGNNWNSYPENRFNWPQEKMRGGIVTEMKGVSNGRPDELLHPYILKLIASPYVGFLYGGGHATHLNFHPKDVKDAKLKAELEAILDEKPYLTSSQDYESEFGESYLKHLIEIAKDESGCGEDGPNDRDYERLTTYGFWNDLKDFFKSHRLDNALRYREIIEDYGYLEVTPDYDEKIAFDEFLTELEKNNKSVFDSLMTALLEESKREEWSDHEEIVSYVQNKQWVQLWRSLGSNSEVFTLIMDAIRRGYMDGTYAEIDDTYSKFIRDLERHTPGNFSIQQNQRNGKMEVEWDTSETVEWSGGGADWDSYEFIDSLALRKSSPECSEYEADYTSVDDYEFDDADDVDPTFSFDAAFDCLLEESQIKLL